MFLVQISDLTFVDIEKLESVFFDSNAERLCLVMVGAENGEHYHVSPSMISTVIGSIKALDSGISKIEVLNEKAAN